MRRKNDWDFWWTTRSSSQAGGRPGGGSGLLHAIAFIRAGEETWRAADRLIAGAPPVARFALAEVKLAR
jgi:hypothetical protein